MHSSLNKRQGSPEECHSTFLLAFKQCKIVKIVISFVKTKTRVRSSQCFRLIIMKDWYWGYWSNSLPTIIPGSTSDYLCPQIKPRHEQLKENEKGLQATSVTARLTRPKSLHITLKRKIRICDSTGQNWPSEPHKHCRVLKARNRKCRQWVKW